MSEGGRMVPVFLVPAGRKIVVFGGGNVSLRKCRHFDGFRIKVIAEEMLPEIAAVAETFVRSTVTAENAGSFMDGAEMVIAATSSKALNGTIRDIAMEKGIPVNSAHGGGDVLIPSTLRRGGFTVAVSSEGRAPSFPPYVMTQIDNFLDNSYEKMLVLLVKLRPSVMEQIKSQPERAEALERIINDSDIWNLLRSGDEEGAFYAAKKEGGLK
ncbi:MAG: bifunctional precorrin-2 dehydrogenase/sirohydrochlorin ferrochelatase [Methanomassiliicoccaceae archaeon]|nr:bifunctional precorrin-2 dehydrogenase/sirohydrochlorin ferrochelatase [Methanomassiliicoccaceae archaeon]